MRTSSIQLLSILSVAFTMLLGCASQNISLKEQRPTPRVAAVNVNAVEQNSFPHDMAFSPANESIHLVGHRTHCACSHCQSASSAAGVIPPADPSLVQMYDSQEFLRDGGDSGPAVVRLSDQTFRGLQPEDTIVHYKTETGHAEIQASNQVALYAPRFRSVRQVSGSLAGGRAVGPAQMDRPIGTVKVDQPLPGLVMRDSLELGHADVARGLDAMRERERTVPVEAVQQLNVASNVMAALVNLTAQQAYDLQGEQKALVHQFANAAVTYQLDECLEVAIQGFRTPSLVRDQRVDGFTVYDFDQGNGRLQISKFADREDARPGDVVTFGIRIENVGDGEVNEVVIVDNLTTRLEYIENSLECEADVEFESVDNQAQSLRLRWELREPLGVGESVTIQFKCSIR